MSLLILSQITEQSLLRSLPKHIISRFTQLPFSQDKKDQENKEIKIKTGNGIQLAKNSSSSAATLDLDKLELSPTLGDEVYAKKRDETRPMYIPEEEGELDLTPPTNCCMSGCANCVWIEYVENLAKFYSNPELSKEKVHRELESFEDPSLKAFIILELKSRGLW